MIAQRLLDRIATAPFDIDPNGEHHFLATVTVSIGAAVLVATNGARRLEGPDRLVCAADRALYHAKVKGRYRVEVARSEELSLAAH